MYHLRIGMIGELSKTFRVTDECKIMVFYSVDVHCGDKRSD